ncbi:hypothetical protein V2G26_016077 [Clonostachys chloroleuca]
MRVDACSGSIGSCQLSHPVRPFASASAPSGRNRTRPPPFHPSIAFYHGRAKWQETGAKVGLWWLPAKKPIRCLQQHVCFAIFWDPLSRLKLFPNGMVPGAASVRNKAPSLKSY